MVVGDINGHIGSTRDGFEDVMGCFSFGVRNQEGENMLGLCQEHNLRVMSSQFFYYRKRRENLISFKRKGEMKVRSIMCCVEDTKN